MVIEWEMRKIERKKERKRKIKENRMLSCKRKRHWEKERKRKSKGAVERDKERTNKLDKKQIECNFVREIKRG